MTNINLDDTLSEEIDKLLKDKSMSLEYGYKKNFVDRAVRDRLRLELKRIKGLE